MKHHSYVFKIQVPTEIASTISFPRWGDNAIARLPDLCASFQEAVVDVLVSKTLAAPVHSTDNAAMIAYAALQRYQAGRFSGLDSDIDPNLALGVAS